MGLRFNGKYGLGTRCLPRVAPEPKTSRIAIGGTSSNAQAEQDDTNDDNDLETGQPELELSKETNTKVVDDDNRN